MPQFNHKDHKKNSMRQQHKSAVRDLKSRVASQPPIVEQEPKPDHMDTTLSKYATPIFIKHAANFKRDLLLSMNDEYQLFGYLGSLKGIKGVFIFRNEQFEYTVLNDDDLLHGHPKIDKNLRQSSFVQMEYSVPKHGYSDKKEFSANLDKHAFHPNYEGDLFLPLGRLIEWSTAGPPRATRFICMINISTSPLSLWIMFDYMLKYKAGNPSSMYEHRHEDDEHSQTHSLTLTGAGCMTGRNDLILVHQNIADWEPTGENWLVWTELSAEFSFHLGSSLIAGNSVAPKPLLDDLASAAACRQVHKAEKESAVEEPKPDVAQHTREPTDELVFDDLFFP